jgi:hypothetical protein
MGESIAMTTFASQCYEASALQNLPLTAVTPLTSSSGMRRVIRRLASHEMRAPSLVLTCARIAARSQQTAALTGPALGPDKEVHHDRDEIERSTSL